jgi:hypothetical protein
MFASGGLDMLCTNCKFELPSQAKFCPNCGTPAPSGATIHTRQEIGDVGSNVVGLTIDGNDKLPGINADTTQKIDKVESGGNVVGTVVGGNQPTHIGGQQHYGDDVRGNKESVNTGGGAFVGGSVTTSGDFVGRDQIVHGDQTKVGNISNSQGVAIGRGASASVTHGLSGDEIGKLYASIYQQIKARPEDPNVDKEELNDTVEKVQKETGKGEQANPDKVARWLKSLADAAPDILDVTVATLTNPVMGVATAIRKVAERFSGQAGHS